MLVPSELGLSLRVKVNEVSGSSDRPSLVERVVSVNLVVHSELISSEILVISVVGLSELSSSGEKCDSLFGLLEFVSLFERVESVIGTVELASWEKAAQSEC